MPARPLRCPMALIRVLHGPNLNLLGAREPELYGTTALADIERALRADADAAGHRLDSFQSDAEHELIEWVHAAAADGVAAMIVNPAAFTHTSVALRDALVAVRVPFIEVHLSNPAAREPFRRQSLFSDIAAGTISGFGPASYRIALAAAARMLDELADAR